MSRFSNNIIQMAALASIVLLAHHTGHAQPLPCTRTIIMDDRGITRAVIPATPFRSINLIFPFDLSLDNTLYSLSSSSIWAFEKANNHPIVPITFTHFSNELWDTVHDFTLAAHDHVFSIALKASPTDHCSNVVFDYSATEKARREQQQQDKITNDYQRTYQAKLDAIDKMVDQRVLEILGELVTAKPKTTRIYTTERAVTAQGDTIAVTVLKAERYGRYTRLLAEVTFDGRTDSAIYLQDVRVEHSEVTGGDVQIVGFAQYEKKMTGKTRQVITFATLDKLPATGMTLVMDADANIVEVGW